MDYTVAALAEELKTLRLPVFDYDTVWQLGTALREIAAAEAAPVAITIAHGTDVVFSLLMPGATIDNFAWAARKRNVVNRFHRASLSLRLEAEASGRDFNARYVLPASDYFATGGGVPLIVGGGVPVGSVAVSGLPDVEDHRMIVRALRGLIDG